MALIVCRDCGYQVSDSAQFCPHCGCPTPPPLPPRVMKQGFMKEVPLTCPKCKCDYCILHSENTKIRPAKVKTSYTVNINPLKPLTIMNKKEKIKRKEKVKVTRIYQCINCGNIFRNLLE